MLCKNTFSRAKALGILKRKSVFYSPLCKNIMNSHVTTAQETKLVAVAQMCCGDDKNENLKIAIKLINEAKNQDCQIIFLPEGFDYIADSKEQSFKLAEPLLGNLLNDYKNLAKSLKIWISLGGFHECEDVASNMDESCKNKLQNTHVVINDEGRIVSIYRKIHLFDVHSHENEIHMMESDTINPGQSIALPVSTPVGTLGLGIIIDPWGTVVANCEQEIGLAIAEINLPYLRKIRSEFPINSHRHQPLYLRALAIGTCLPFPDDNETFQFGQVVLKGEVIFCLTQHSMAFVNKKCILPGHVLVACRRSALRLHNLTSVEVSDLFCLVLLVERVMEEIHGAQSSTIAVQDGPEAGQSIKVVKN